MSVVRFSYWQGEAESTGGTRWGLANFFWGGFRAIRFTPRHLRAGPWQLRGAAPIPAARCIGSLRVSVLS